MVKVNVFRYVSERSRLRSLVEKSRFDRKGLFTWNELVEYENNTSNESKIVVEYCCKVGQKL